VKINFSLLFWEVKPGKFPVERKNSQEKCPVGIISGKIENFPREKYKFPVS
jgi:hypothetical protein